MGNTHTRKGLYAVRENTERFQMRKFQLTITLDCFDNPSKKSVKVYTDANNVWEAVCAGFRRLTDCLNKEGYALPQFGVVDSRVEDE